MSPRAAMPGRRSATTAGTSRTGSNGSGAPSGESGAGQQQQVTGYRGQEQPRPRPEADAEETTFAIALFGGSVYPRSFGPPGACGSEEAAAGGTQDDSHGNGTWASAGSMHLWREPAWSCNSCRAMAPNYGYYEDPLKRELRTWATATAGLSYAVRLECVRGDMAPAARGEHRLLAGRRLTAGPCLVRGAGQGLAGQLERFALVGGIAPRNAHHVHQETAWHGKGPLDAVQACGHAAATAAGGSDRQGRQVPQESKL